METEHLSFTCGSLVQFYKVLAVVTDFFLHFKLKGPEKAMRQQMACRRAETRYTCPSPNPQASHSAVLHVIKTNTIDLIDQGALAQRAIPLDRGWHGLTFGRDDVDDMRGKVNKLHYISPSGLNIHCRWEGEQSPFRQTDTTHIQFPNGNDRPSVVFKVIRELWPFLTFWK